MKKEWLLFSCIFVLAIFLRLYKIDIIPPGLHGDEAQSGIEAVRILNGAPYTPYSPEVYGQTTFYFYLVAAVFKIFGVSATSIRLTSALLGILTIPLFYLFIRYFFNQQAALFSTFLLAISRWHIHLSRLGLMSITTTLFQAGFFLFLLKGLKTKKILDFILAGIFLTLGLNSYMAFRFLPLILIAFLCFLFFTQREIVKNNLRGLILFSITTVILLLPLLTYAFTNWDIFMGRMQSIYIFNNHPFGELPSILFNNLKGALLMFNFRGSTWPHKNLPGAPLLDMVTGIFFIIGIVQALLNFKKPIYFLLLINLLTMLGINVFSESVYPPAGDPIRSSGTIISVFIFAGVGVNWLWHFYKKLQVVLIPTLGVALLLNFGAYFFALAQHPAVWHDFHFVPVEVAKLSNQNPQAHIYLLSDWFYSDYLSIRFLAPNFSGEDFLTKLGKYTPKDELLPLKNNLGKDSIFVILPFYNQYLNRLKEVYPEGKLKKHYGGPENKLIFSTYFVSKND